MKRKITQTRWLWSILLVFLCLLPLMTIPISAQSYSVIGSVLTTDIRATINGCEVSAYNVDGNMVIVAADLRNYGFDVAYDNNTRTCTITYSGNGMWNPIVNTPVADDSVGKKVMNVYDTDIVVYINGVKVDAYNVDGHMAFRFAEMKVYGTYWYDNDSRTANLKIGNGDNSVSTANIHTSDSDRFANIRIDENGYLIFTLANGQELNAGVISKSKDGLNGKDGKNGRDGQNGRDGHDGKDGVSVIDASVDSSGNLIFKLSNGKQINAGNIYTGGSKHDLTFADYPIGTRFYLSKPTGAFDVTIMGKGEPYTVSFENVYYELIAKHDFDDPDAWVYENNHTCFVPYEVKIHMEGTADVTLAGRELMVVFADVEACRTNQWTYRIKIADNGTFSKDGIHGEGGTLCWGTPRKLIFKEIYFSPGNGFDAPNTEPEIDPEVQRLLPKLAGTWEVPTLPDKQLILKTDGTIVEDGTEYKPDLWIEDGFNRSRFLYAKYNDTRVSLYIDGNPDDINIRYHYLKTGTWEAVKLTAENYLNYYEYRESFEIRHNAFGEWTGAILSHSYVLKDEYSGNIIEKYDVATKVQCNIYKMEYSIDFENRTYTVIEPGELYDSSVIVKDGSLGNTYFEPSEKTCKYHKYQLIDATGMLYLIKGK